MRRLALALLMAVQLMAAATAEANQPTGTRPTFTDRQLTGVPNGAAILRSLWVPGLDDGFVPQGLAIQDGIVFLSGYVSVDPKQGRGPCRLYRIDPQSLAVNGRLDLPAACGHAGGAARGSRGTLYVADTHVVIEVRLTSGTGEVGTVVRTTRLKGRLLGSFAAGSSDALWLGGYRREGDAETRLYRIPFTALAAPEIDETQATASLPLPDRAQGAAFAPDGGLWITRSGSKFGELLRLDPKTGSIRTRHDMPAGIEDISFAPDGRLWSVVEAGSRRWNSWTTFFPLVFEIDVARLR